MKNVVSAVLPMALLSPVLKPFAGGNHRHATAAAMHNIHNIDTTATATTTATTATATTTASTTDPSVLPPIDNISILRKRSHSSLTTIPATVRQNIADVFRHSESRDQKFDQLTTTTTTTTTATTAATTVAILAPGLGVNHQLELVSPDVYKTLFLWYGGGPQVTIDNNSIFLIVFYVI
jgi:hypothetical protein